jgi:sacsin
MLHLIHPRVSAPVAAALGIASRRRLLLVAAADTMSLSLVTAGGVVEAWGQSEDLCSRLKHILQVGSQSLLSLWLGDVTNP